MSSTTSRASSARSRRPGCPRRSPSAWLTACSALLLLLLGAGCGSEEAAAPTEPRLPAATAERLASLADAVADAAGRGDGCEARERADELTRATTDAINAGQVPPALQEIVLSEAQELAAQLECAPAPPPAVETEDGEGDDGDREKRGKRKKDKGDREDRRDDDDDEDDPVETQTETQAETTTTTPGTTTDESAEDDG